MALNVLLALGFEEQLPMTVLADFYSGGGPSYTTGVYGNGIAVKMLKGDYIGKYVSTTATAYTAAFWGRNGPTMTLKAPEGEIRLRIYWDTITLDAPGLSSQSVGGLTVYDNWHYWALEKNGGTIRILFDGNEVLNITGTTATTLEWAKIGGYDNGPDWHEYDHVVIHEGTYVGYELFLRPIQPAADVSSSMDGREPASAASNAEVVDIPYNNSSYIYSTGASISKSAIMSTTMPALPSDIQEVSVEAVVVWGVVDENVATSSTTQIGLEKAGTTYLSANQSLQTASRAFQHVFPQNPETATDWTNSAEVAGFNLVVQHNHA